MMSEETAGTKTIYIAGPMSGFPQYNFPAFFKAQEVAFAAGWKGILNPAAMDVIDGFDARETDQHPTAEQIKSFKYRDLNWLSSADAILLLPGWRDSEGATTEATVAYWLGQEFYGYHSEKIWPIDRQAIKSAIFGKEELPATAKKETVLAEAARLTSGDRQNQYGPPDQDFRRTAAMWSALKGVEFTASEVASMMICIKLSRQTHQRKRDNWVDIAGYAHCGHVCDECAK